MRQKTKVEIVCIRCNKSHTVEIYEDDYKEVSQHVSQRKRYVQDIVPYLTPDLRELLISKICGTCYDDMFKEYEKE